MKEASQTESVKICLPGIQKYQHYLFPYESEDKTK